MQLWNRSLLENLRYGTDQAHKPLGDAVEAAELDEVLARLPMGLQTSVGANGALLSGGEGQRVRLARGIGREQPRLVILDEAFCGLERARRSSLLAAARVRWQSATLLCITHDIADTLSFSRVLVIEEGRVIEDGTPAALAALADSRYARLLAAERRALARLTGARWRRFRVESGEITADPKAAGRGAAAMTAAYAEASGPRPRTDYSWQADQLGLALEAYLPLSGRDPASGRGACQRYPRRWTTPRCSTSGAG